MADATPMPDLPAISVWQPHATLIALEIKPWETRSKPCPPKYIGERIAIHAAKRVPDAMELGDWVVGRLDLGAPRRLWRALGPIHDLPLGAVVCTAVVAESLPIVGEDGDLDGAPDECIERRPDGCVNAGLWLHSLTAELPVDISDQLPYGLWTPGRHAWRLVDVEPVDPPIPARGRQGWWRWEDPR